MRRRSLNMAALAAARSKSDLGNFYKGLVKRGKKPNMWYAPCR